MRRGAATVTAGALGRLAIVALLLAAAAIAQPVFPPLTGRVVDEAGILDPALEQRLARDLEAHERATGDQVVVATLRSLQGTTVEDFANRLYRHWKLGQAKEDDGALLVVAPTERKVRVEVGYGLEGVLTDAAAATIVQSLVLPRFRAGDLPGGVEAGARGILELLRPEDGTATTTASPQQAPGWTGQPRQEAASGGPSWIFVLLAFLCFIMLARAFNRSRTDQRRSRSPNGPWGGTAPYRRGYGRRGGLGFPPVIVLPGGFGHGGGGGFGGGFGGGGGGGGGFSGGGGSSGGGGASGSW